MRKLCPIDQVPTEADSFLCPNHSRAFTRLLSGFSKWKEAMGPSFSFSDYLHALTAETTPTGKWVREVADAILVGILPFPSPPFSSSSSPSSSNPPLESPNHE